MLRAIVDANVWISALIVSGTSRRLIFEFEDQRFTLIYPSYLLVELPRCLTRPKLASRLVEADVLRLIELIETLGVLVNPDNITGVSRDPGDDVYLACAEKSGCDFLVTGDKDLLILGQYGKTGIVSPAQFLEYLGSR